ncbi:hypothetical protein LEP1GSC064_2977 [Leptospira kirschneri serovar Grippotyphosa str. Moskva]|nr:hypothetical protein LEP1GSC064_2977 [Leptospira kirschneri serovar Grippotyphosa str. Moskva]EKR07999.1 hypothetical protein LEP1GSC122_2033 [Leptospira kirschneri serovar Valbuzzi str. 200702274]
MILLTNYNFAGVLSIGTKRFTIHRLQFFKNQLPQIETMDSNFVVVPTLYSTRLFFVI